MTYQITITKQGNVIDVLTGINAPDALAAIASAERGYTARAVSQTTGDSSKTYQWTGLEFEARRVN